MTDLSNGDRVSPQSGRKSPRFRPLRIRLSGFVRDVRQADGIGMAARDGRMRHGAAQGQDARHRTDAADYLDAVEGPLSAHDRHGDAAQMEQQVLREEGFCQSRLAPETRSECGGPAPVEAVSLLGARNEQGHQRQLSGNSARRGFCSPGGLCPGLGAQRGRKDLDL